MSKPILEIRDLEIGYGHGGASASVVRSVSFAIDKGRTLGLVGESGSGKSTIALAIMGLLPKAGIITGGSITFDGIDLGPLSPIQRRALRGGRIGMVFQDPFLSLNSALTIGTQVSEAITQHSSIGRRAARARTIELLGEVGLPRPQELIQAYPFQLSGGMRQRIMIATALSCEPDLLILDEPTTALDVTVEAQILDLLAGLRRRRALSIMLISHSLGVVRQFCDEVAVLYAGETVEQAPADVVFQHPAHPYTKGLLAALPRLGASKERLSSIEGRVPSPGEWSPGCIFAPRCAFTEEKCAKQPQALLAVNDDQRVRCWKAADLAGADWPVPADAARRGAVGNSDVLVDIAEVSKSFSLGRGRFRFTGGLFPFRFEKRRVNALCGISLQLRSGQALGIVGESGSGKSTLGRCVVQLTTPDAGTIRYRQPGPGHARGPRAATRMIQMIFQSPSSSLNPYKTVHQILDRPLVLFGNPDTRSRDRRIAELLEQVRLPTGYSRRHPHELSGGEKQRVAIARALAASPTLIVCDEAVAALDVSVQASVLNLLADLRDELGVGYLFISHDIAVVAHIADRIAVMYRGTVVEDGPTAAVLAPPYHPYTHALLESVPVIDRARSVAAESVLENPVSAPSEFSASLEPVCVFRHRCPIAIPGRCDREPPAVQVLPDGHRILCHVSPDEPSGRNVRDPPELPSARAWS